MGEVLATTAEIAVVMGGNWTAADVEREAQDLGMPIIANWAGKSSLRAEDAKDFVSGEAQRRNGRAKAFQDADRIWQKSRRQAIHAAVKAATDNQMGYFTAESLARANAVAVKAGEKFDRNNPRPQQMEVSA